MPFKYWIPRDWIGLLVCVADKDAERVGVGSSVFEAGGIIGVVIRVVMLSFVGASPISEIETVVLASAERIGRLSLAEELWPPLDWIDWETLPTKKNRVNRN